MASTWMNHLLRALLLPGIWLLGLATIVGSGPDPAPEAAILGESGDQSVVVGTTARFSVTAENAASYQWQVMPAGGAWGDVPGATRSALAIEGVTLALNGNRYRVAVSGGGKTVLSSAFLLTVRTADEAPTISTSPTDQSVIEGQTATFVVVAAGTAPTFEWQSSTDGGLSWATVAGASGDRLDLPNLTMADSGRRIRVVVRNAAGSVTSAAVLLTVSAAVVAPDIVVQPADVAANPGQTATFSVSAVGTTLAYRWESSADGVAWTTMAGATASALHVADLTLADSGRRFRVVVSNTAGSATSGVATLTVTAVVVAPVITAQPVGQTVVAGQNTSMSVVATGTAPRYQWQLSTTGGASWTNVAGATTATLVLNTVPLADDGKRFRVVVENSAGSVTSDAALLSVTPAIAAPTIVAQPSGAVRIVGQDFATTVTASGTGLAYAWETSVDGADPWTPLAGATAATLTVPVLSITDNERRYRARVSNGGGSVTSGSALLTVRWGVVTTSSDVSRLENVYPDTGGDGGNGVGDGGTSGGGDGDGVGSGGGLGKTLNATMTVTRLADGALVGQALTHPATGLVSIKAGRGTGPVLLTLEGNANATYYDEGKKAYLPFGPGQVLHALVDQFDENLGVTPLTEAAYRYALNNFIGNPAAISAGTAPLLKAGSVVGLTQAQVRSANAAVLAEFNRLLPAATRLTSLKALPTPIDGASPGNALVVSRYGLAAVATGGLVINANDYLPTADGNALTLTEQIARDLTDGVLDGFALDGSASAAGSALTYDSARLALGVDAAGYDISAAFGSGTTYLLGTGIVDFVLGSTGIDADPAGICAATWDNIVLRKDRGVNVLRLTPGPSSTCVDVVAGQTLLRDFLTDVRFIRSRWTQAFAVMRSGTVVSWGDNTCGALGVGRGSGGAQLSPMQVVGLGDVTSLTTGNAWAIARDKTGSVYSWGTDLWGTLGLGDAVTYDLTSCGPFSTSGMSAPRRIPSLRNVVAVASSSISAYALDSDGRVFRWGFAVDPSGAWFRQSTPEILPGLSQVVSITTSYDVLLALRADGTVWGQGLNQIGTFGDGSTSPKGVPAAVPGLDNIVAIGGANFGAAAIRRDGTVLAWDQFTRVARVLGEVTICDTPRVENGVGPCLNPRRQPMPKVRPTMGDGIYLMMFGADGETYVLPADGTDRVLRVLPETYR